MPGETAPYGKWDSPITLDYTVSDTVFDDVLVDPITEAVYHLEERPENGSCVIVDTLTDKEVLPQGQQKYSVRDSVNDYGGAAAIVYCGIVYFSNDYDKSIYAYDIKEHAPIAQRVTPDNPAMRYANFAVYPKETQTPLLVTIREDHTKDPTGKTPQNVVYTLSIVNTKNASVTVLVHGADFYASPVFNESGTKIAWQEWYLPDMPWEGGIIYVADVIPGEGSITIANRVEVAGKRREIAATFPTWINDTVLLYTSDGANKFQNPFIFDAQEQNSKPVLNTPLDRDFAEPAWWLGLYPYAILGDGQYGVFTAFEDGRNILFVIGLGGSSDPFQIKGFDYAVAEHLRPLGKNTFVFTGSKSNSPAAVVLGTIQGSPGAYTATFEELRNSPLPSSLAEYISEPIPKPLTAPRDQHKIYAVYYAPHNPKYVGPPGEKPPCIINVHGGPTGLEGQALNWTKMFFTSRGYAWLDVNYRGSSGYGREYIQLLYKYWGVYDVEDCKIAHQLLAEAGLIHAKHVAIRGGSAGAYTTLSSLTFAPDPGYYKAACGAYGCVADPSYITKVIEKLESQYIYTLFGSPPGGAVWDQRNPIEHIKGNFSVPLQMLQGDKDGVVPVEVVIDFKNEVLQDAPGVPINLTTYPGEGHHFHEKVHILDALNREHEWYLKYLLE